MKAKTKLVAKNSQLCCDLSDKLARDIAVLLLRFIDIVREVVSPAEGQIIVFSAIAAVICKLEHGFGGKPGLVDAFLDAGRRHSKD